MNVELADRHGLGTVSASTVNPKNWEPVPFVESDPIEKALGRLAAVVNTTDRSISGTLLVQAIGASTHAKGDITPDWQAVASMLSGIEPRNAQEVMLAIQMVAVHFQTVDLMRKSVETGHLNVREQHLKLAIKLSRLFAAQAETLKRLRSKGEQRMVVEHVHVHSGGQAIVGQVSGEMKGGRQE